APGEAAVALTSRKLASYLLAAYATNVPGTFVAFGLIRRSSRCARQLEPGVTKLLQSRGRRYIAAATAGQGVPAPTAAVERGHGLEGGASCHGPARAPPCT